MILSFLWSPVLVLAIPDLESLRSLPVFPISEPGIVGIFVGNRTMIDLFTASIADVGSPIKFAAAFFLKIRTGLVTGGTGSTFNAAKKDLIAGIRFLTTENAWYRSSWH